MRISKARFPIAHLSLPNQLDVARAVVRQTRANTSLPADDEPLTALERETEALAGAEKAIALLRAELAAAIAARKDREHAFRKACLSFAGHVNSIAQGDEAKILGTGLVLQRSTRPPLTAEATPAPLDVRGAPAELPKQVRLRWRAVPKARAYLIERSAGPVEGFVQVGAATTRQILLLDQPTDRAYWYRVAALGRGGTGPWSTPHPVHPLADFANEFRAQPPPAPPS